MPTETNPCPCASGYVCCSSGVCATDQGGCGAVTAVLSQAVAGDWTGYLEDFSFPSGSDAIKISIAVAPDGALSGQVVLGAGSAPPTATDPDVAWPQGVSAASVRYGLEGASYDALNILWEANRLKFSISLYSPWAAVVRAADTLSQRQSGLQLRSSDRSLRRSGTADHRRRRETVSWTRRRRPPSIAARSSLCAWEHRPSVHATPADVLLRKFPASRSTLRFRTVSEAAAPIFPSSAGPPPPTFASPRSSSWSAYLRARRDSGALRMDRRPFSPASPRKPR